MTYNDEKLRALGYVPTETDSPYWPVVYERKGDYGFYKIMISKDLGVVARQGVDKSHLETGPLTCREFQAVAQLLESMGVTE